jgi:hypothetical protein
MLELQGELDCEGDSSGQVIGVLGLERLVRALCRYLHWSTELTSRHMQDKPTLYLGAHHLLHGKIVNLPRPLAVIRRAATDRGDDDDLLGDGGEEESSEEEDNNGQAAAGPSNQFLTPARPAHLRPADSSPPGPSPTPSRPTASSSALPPHLQPPASSPTGPRAGTSFFSSSPVGPPSQTRDYSSDLSSPVRPSTTPSRIKRKRVDDGGRTSKRRERTDKVPRTRHYEVIGVVRKKVVFGLRLVMLMFKTTRGTY